MEKLSGHGRAVQAARFARGLGFKVRNSKQRDMNKVSSYYLLNTRGQSFMRISDHPLPWTPRRQFYSDERGPIIELIYTDHDTDSVLDMLIAVLYDTGE